MMKIMKKVLIPITIIISGLIFKSCATMKTAVTPDGLFGSVKLDSITYFDQLEVNVESWLSYYTWMLQNKGYDSAQAVLPDSTAVPKEVWAYIKLGSPEFNKGLGIHTLKPVGYFCRKCKDHFDYNDFLDSKPEICPYLRYPITGLSFEQVTDFCKWRTKHVGGGIYEYRLPTEAEWIRFAKNGLEDSLIENGIPDSLLNDECVCFNYKVEEYCKFYRDLGFTKFDLIASAHYNPDKNDAYDVFGNASEMTNVKGIAKGGNFTTYAIQCHYDSIQHYDKPETWLGFRCIAIKRK